MRRRKKKQHIRNYISSKTLKQTKKSCTKSESVLFFLSAYLDVFGPALGDDLTDDWLDTLQRWSLAFDGNVSREQVEVVVLRKQIFLRHHLPEDQAEGIHVRLCVSEKNNKKKKKKNNNNKKKKNDIRTTTQTTTTTTCTKGRKEKKAPPLAYLDSNDWLLEQRLGRHPQRRTTAVIIALQHA
jgi:hypothetical protein